MEYEHFGMSHILRWITLQTHTSTWHPFLSPCDIGFGEDILIHGLLCGIWFLLFHTILKNDPSSYPSIGDCHNSAGQKNMCVSGAINNYTMQLMSAYKDSNMESKCKFSVLLGFCHGYNWGTHFSFFNRQLDRGTYVLITFHWGYPSGVLSLLLPRFNIWKKINFSSNYLSSFSIL